MFATEYDLVVAEHDLRDRRAEMMAIRMAEEAHSTTVDHPSLIGRLLALTSHGTEAQDSHGKIDAAA